ncbi:hypothetical protein SDC9_151401 [bioreactor metagenome]|uniref:Uncharacterized protein n=1 Tax=bioreactor metagenome TaxID=1076179 RepID=A0A645EQ72_9ZZZZ
MQRESRTARVDHNEPLFVGQFVPLRYTYLVSREPGEPMQADDKRHRPGGIQVFGNIQNIRTPLPVDADMPVRTQAEQEIEQHKRSTSKDQ